MPHVELGSNVRLE